MKNPRKTRYKSTSKQPDAFGKNLALSLMAITSHWDNIAELSDESYVTLCLRACSREVKKAIEEARNGLVAKFPRKTDNYIRRRQVRVVKC